MSEDKQKKGFWAFWTTLPGILTEIAAVLIAVAGLYEVFQNSQETSAADSKQISSKTETRIVEANDRDGESYRNSTDKPVTVDFTAEGEWLAIPTHNEVRNSSAKGFLSPEGALQFESNPNLPCPDLPLGALVVKMKSECPAYGKQGSFDLGRGETAYFLMNDVQSEKLYGDNEGKMTVELSIK